nr:hypothetical protein [uncultured Agathobaculum sp.]
MTIGGFQSNWFNVTEHTMENGNKLPMATLKDEYKDEFAAYTESKLQQLTQREPSAGLDALTDEQLKELSEKYDTDEMTYDEYQSFLNDLVDKGALTETDRWLAGGTDENGLTPVTPAMAASVRDASQDTPSMSQLTYSFPFDADSVDITEWVKYRASHDMAYYISGERYDINEDKANQTVADILSAMSRVS